MVLKNSKDKKCDVNLQNVFRMIAQPSTGNDPEVETWCFQADARGRLAGGVVH